MFSKIIVGSVLALLPAAFGVFLCAIYLFAKPEHNTLNMVWVFWLLWVVFTVYAFTSISKSQVCYRLFYSAALLNFLAPLVMFYSSSSYIQNRLGGREIHASGREIARDILGSGFLSGIVGVATVIIGILFLLGGMFFSRRHLKKVGAPKN